MYETNSEEIDPTKLLDTLYSGGYTRGGPMHWLSDKNIYSVDDPGLAPALASHRVSRFIRQL